MPDMNSKGWLKMAQNKEQVTRLLKTARGQIDGVLRMIEEDRYCIDVANQLLSLEAILKKCRQNVLQNHLLTCVKNASGKDDLENKVNELVKVLEKMG